jgi:hypothetical protein
VQVASEFTYDADPATVFRMLSDKSFQERKLSQSGALSWSVTVSAPASEGGETTISSVRGMPTDRVPDAFRSMAGSEIRIEQTERWGPAAADGSRSGTLEVQVGGAPVRLTGTLSLSAAGAGTVEAISGELKARVPLLGGKIEKAVEPAVMEAIRAEQRTGTAWLAEHSG